MALPKARQVDIPDEAILNEEVYHELQTHAINSAKWYADTGKTEGEVRDKLLDKGYIEQLVTVVFEDGREEDFDMISIAINKARESYMFVPEDSLADILSKEYSTRGKSIYDFTSMLRKRKFKDEVVSLFTKSYNKERAIEMAFERLEPSVLRKAKTAYDWTNGVTQKLSGRGFSYSDISSFIETVKEERGPDLLDGSSNKVKSLQWWEEE